MVHYCLVINAQNNEETFCDAVDHVIGKSPKLFCSRLKAILNNYLLWPADRISNIGNTSFSPLNCEFNNYFFIFQVDSKRGTALACTGLRNKHTLTGLIPNKNYFVDVFGVHKKVPGLIFKLASTTLAFNSSNPIELHEDQPEIGKLSKFDKRSSFVFKVNYGYLLEFFS